MLLRRRRIQHGALVLTMPEVKIDLDADGRVAGAHVVEDTESHQMIEEFMLAANEAVAEMLRDKGVPFPAADPRIAQPAQAARPDRVRPRVGPARRAACTTASNCSSCSTRWPRPARAACRELRRAAGDAAGRLQPQGRRPLRPGQRLLLPLHLAHPPLSRPAHPPPAGRVDPQAASRDCTWANWSCWGSTAATASSGPTPPSAT